LFENRNGRMAPLRVMDRINQDAQVCGSLHAQLDQSSWYFRHQNVCMRLRLDGRRGEAHYFDAMGSIFHSSAFARTVRMALCASPISTG